MTKSGTLRQLCEALAIICEHKLRSLRHTVLWFCGNRAHSNHRGFKNTLHCNVQSLLTLSTLPKDWVIDCVCVRVCVNLKAGTNPPNKHVSSHLWLDPAGNQDSALQKLIFTGRICCMLGIERAVYCLSVWFPVRGSVVQMSRSLQPHVSFLPPSLPFLTSSILDLPQSAGPRLKVNREVTVKAAQWWQDQWWLKLASGWRGKKKEMHQVLSVWLNVCTVQTLTTLVSLCCPLHLPVIYIPSAYIS